jgi:D-arabinose 5-phosphate isomerase GutQ
MEHIDAWSQATSGWQTYRDALTTLESQLDRQQWLAVLKTLARCEGKIAVTGIGTSHCRQKDRPYAFLRRASRHLA